MGNATLHTYEPFELKPIHLCGPGRRQVGCTLCSEFWMFESERAAREFVLEHARWHAAQRVAEVTP